MPNKMVKIETGILLEDSDTFSIVKLCRACSLPAETIIKMVERGVINPIDSSLSYTHWQFPYTSLLRVQTALRLQRDLELNLAGAVLALELLDEIKQLRQQVVYLQR